MMLKLILFLITITGLSLAGNWILEHDGKVIIHWLDMEISLQFSVALFLTILTIISLGFILHSLWWFAFSRARFLFYLEKKQHQSGIQALSSSFMALAKGDSKDAKKQAAIVRKSLGTLPVLEVIDNQVAHLQGNSKASQLSVHRMLEHEETKDIAHKEMVEEALKHNEIAKAITLLEQTTHNVPNSKWAQLTLIDLYIHTALWDKALENLNLATKKGWIDRATHKRSISYIHYQQGVNLLQQDTKTARKYFHKALRSLPSFAPLYIALASSYDPVTELRKHRNILDKAMQKTVHPKLIRTRLMLINTLSTKAQYKVLKAIIKHNNNHPIAYQEVANWLVEHGRPDTALNYAKIGYAEKHYRGLVEIMLTILKQTNASNETIEKWNGRLKDALPDPEWVCNNCHFHAGIDWDINCYNCKGFATYQFLHD